MIPLANNQIYSTGQMAWPSQEVSVMAKGAYLDSRDLRGAVTRFKDSPGGTLSRKSQLQLRTFHMNVSNYIKQLLLIKIKFN